MLCIIVFYPYGQHRNYVLDILSSDNRHTSTNIFFILVVVFEINSDVFFVSIIDELITTFCIYFSS